MTRTIAALALATLLTPMTVDLGAAVAGTDTGAQIRSASDATDMERRGRGRGGRSKPRVPGGSGCDDPRDLIEHPECLQ